MPELDAPSMTDASGDARRPQSATCIPALENGDRLTRCEFERRYAARPDLKKAELIEGVVYMPSPVRLAHSGPHAMSQTVLLVYTAFTPGSAGTTTLPSASISTTSLSPTCCCVSRRRQAASRA